MGIQRVVALSQRTLSGKVEVRIVVDEPLSHSSHQGLELSPRHHRLQVEAARHELGVLEFLRALLGVHLGDAALEGVEKAVLFPLLQGEGGHGVVQGLARMRRRKTLQIERTSRRLFGLTFKGGLARGKQVGDVRQLGLEGWQRVDVSLAEGVEARAGVLRANFDFLVVFLVFLIIIRCRLMIRCLRSLALRIKNFFRQLGSHLLRAHFLCLRHNLGRGCTGSLRLHGFFGYGRRHVALGVWVQCRLPGGHGSAVSNSFGNTGGVRIGR